MSGVARLEGVILVEVLLEYCFDCLEVLEMFLEVVQRLLYAELNGPCWVPHVMDYHVHEYPIGIDLR